MGTNSFFGITLGGPSPLKFGATKENLLVSNLGTKQKYALPLNAMHVLMCLCYFNAQ